MLFIKMVRGKAEYPYPHEADVHLDEVANYAQAGFVVFEEARKENDNDESGKANSQQRETVATESHEGPIAEAKVAVTKMKAKSAEEKSATVSAKWAQPPKA